jgi:uncharacterized membrane protein YkoI
MRQLLVSTFALTTLAIGAARAQDIPPYIDPELAKQAKITQEDAQQIALRRHRGQVADVRISKESGGSGLRWIIQIKQTAGSYEVEIDAKTGKILEDVRSAISQ